MLHRGKLIGVQARFLVSDKQLLPYLNMSKMVQHKINKKITISIFASRVIVVTAAPTENHMGVDIVKRVTTIMVIVMIFSIIDIIDIL